MVCWYQVRDLATTRLDEIYCAGSGPLKVLDPATTGLNGRLCAGSRYRGTTRDLCVRHLHKHHGTLQDLFVLVHAATKSFPGTGNFSILYVYQTRLIWGKYYFANTSEVTFLSEKK